MPLTSSDLVPETGVGLANSNTYATIAEADAYHTLRDNTAWTGAAEHNKVAALIRASDYVDRRWRFIGVRKLETQAMQWPREGAADRDGFPLDDEVPPAIKEATMEYALRIVAALGDLMPDPTENATGAFVVLERSKAGPVEEEFRYSDKVPLSSVKAYPSADRIITNAKLALSTSNSVIRG